MRMVFYCACLLLAYAFSRYSISSWQERAFVDASVELFFNRQDPERWINHALCCHSREALSDLNTAIDIDPTNIRAHNLLAILYWKQRRYEQAERTYHKALAMSEKKLGGKNLRLVQIVDELALFYDCRGRDMEAEANYNRALAIVQTAIGPEDQYLAAYLNRVANFYARRGNCAQAESLFKRCLLMQIKTASIPTKVSSEDVPVIGCMDMYPYNMNSPLLWYGSLLGQTNRSASAAQLLSLNQRIVQYAYHSEAWRLSREQKDPCSQVVLKALREIPPLKTKIEPLVSCKGPEPTTTEWYILPDP